MGSKSLFVEDFFTHLMLTVIKLSTRYLNFSCVVIKSIFKKSVFKIMLFLNLLL